MAIRKKKIGSRSERIRRGALELKAESLEKKVANLLARERHLEEALERRDKNQSDLSIYCEKMITKYTEKLKKQIDHNKVLVAMYMDLQMEVFTKRMAASKDD